jgi:hypothetical protein
VGDHLFAIPVTVLREDKSAVANKDMLGKSAEAHSTGVDDLPIFVVYG